MLQSKKMYDKTALNEADISNDHYVHRWAPKSIDHIFKDSLTWLWHIFLKTVNLVQSYQKNRKRI